MGDLSFLILASVLMLSIGIGKSGSDNSIDYDSKFCERVSKDVKQYLLCEDKIKVHRESNGK